MKKIFTLLTLFAASIGVIDAQTTVSWSLSQANDLSGTSSEATINVSNVSNGSNLTINGTKTYSGGTGTLFSPTTDLKEHKTAKTDGTNLVTFKFTIPTGFKFVPTNLSFFGAKDGSGNNHYADIKINDDIIIKQYAFVRGDSSNPGEKKSQTISSESQYEGEVSLSFNLYGKSTNARKGWVIGDVILTGTLSNSGDTRTNAPISWDKESVSLKVRDQFNAPTLTNSENLAVTFSSNNTSVANVDEKGAITLVDGAIGTAIISATYTGTAADDANASKYKTTTAFTTITVNTNVVDAYAWAEYPAEPLPSLTKIWKAAKTSGISTADSELFGNDENISVKTVYAPKYSNYVKNYLGQEFSGAMQAGRAGAAPTADNLTGTESSGNTPLVVTPAKDMKLYMFIRRQGLEQSVTTTDDTENNIITKTHVIGYSANDGKSVYASDQSDITKKLDQKLYFGLADGEAKGNDYIYVAAEWSLLANHTYTIWTTGTTIHMNAIGYYIEPVEAPSAHLYLGENETNEHPAFNGEDYNQIYYNDVTNHGVTLKHDNTGAEIYWNFTAATDANEPATNEPAAQVGETTVEKDGMTYNLYTGPIKEISANKGTLSYFARLNGVDSEVKTVTVNDQGTSIDEIGVDTEAAPAEYFNLQGVRVAADALTPGIYVKRQGNKATKVYVK